MKHHYFSIAIILLFAVIFDIRAQQSHKIVGTVLDEKSHPLPFVNVYILNSNKGSTTNDSGKFTFSAILNDESTIVASMVGYDKFEQKININEQKFIGIDIILKKEIIKLQESIVLGSSFGSEKSKGVVLSSQDVYTTPGGAADIFQSLKTLPGLTQVSESAQLFVRGGDPIETVTMLDGATLYHPYTYESSYGGLFSNLNTSTVRGLYFSSGGFSAKYGNALSGILDIETKNEPERTNFLVGLSMAAASVNGEIPINDKLGLRFTSQRSYTKPIMWFNGALDEFSTAPTSGDLSLSILYRYSKSGRIKLFGLLAKDEQGVNVDRAEYDGVFNGNSANEFINIRHTDILSPNLLTKNSLSFNRHSNNWNLGLLDLQQTDDVIKFRSDVEYQLLNELKIVSGIEIENRKRNYTGIIPEEEYDIRPEGLSEKINVNINNTRIAGYTELELKNMFGVSNLFLVAGTRVDWFPALDINWIDPRAGIGYHLSKKSNIKIAWGIFHQLPDLRLFSPDDGNPNLSSMRADHLVISYDLQLNKFNSIRIEAFHKKYSNLPLENKTVNYNNNGFGFADGIDFIAKGRLPLGLEGWLSYGLINTKRKWLDFEKLSRSNFDITHNLAIVLNYRLHAMWKIGINYKFATGRPYTPILSSEFNSGSGIYEPTYGADNSDRFPNYHRLDFRITHLNQLFNNYFGVFYIEALNILDIENLFGYSYNPDYSERFRIKSYFGRRTIVFGAQITF